MTLVAFAAQFEHQAAIRRPISTAFAAIIMTGIVIVALLYRPVRRLFRTGGCVSLALLLVYVLNTRVLHLYRH